MDLKLSAHALGSGVEAGVAHLAHDPRREGLDEPEEDRDREAHARDGHEGPEQERVLERRRRRDDDGLLARERVDVKARVNIKSQYIALLQVSVDAPVQLPEGGYPC